MKKIEEPGSGTRIAFQNVYDSPEWKELAENERAQLILVAEGKKKGTIIMGDHTHTPEILKKLGLDWSIRNENQNELHPAYRVAKEDDLLADFGSTYDVPLGQEYEQFHKLNGKFLSYPSCCTQEYCFPSVTGKTPRFEQELCQVMRETGTYPEEFDFLPHSFTPCSVHCTHAKKLLKEWADTVKAADPDAARSLQEYNREIFRDVFDRNMSTTDHIILNVKKHGSIIVP